MGKIKDFFRKNKEKKYINKKPHRVTIFLWIVSAIIVIASLGVSHVIVKKAQHQIIEEPYDNKVSYTVYSNYDYNHNSFDKVYAYIEFKNNDSKKVELSWSGGGNDGGVCFIKFSSITLNESELSNYLRCSKIEIIFDNGQTVNFSHKNVSLKYLEPTEQMMMKILPCTIAFVLFIISFLQYIHKLNKLHQPRSSYSFTPVSSNLEAQVKEMIEDINDKIDEINKEPQMIKCDYCGANNKATNPVCERCGASFVKTKPKKHTNK